MINKSMSRRRKFELEQIRPQVIRGTSYSLPGHALVVAGNLGFDYLWGVS
jgi:hypothetical protein